MTDASKQKDATGLGALGMLPYELRHAIYNYVLGDQLLHIDLPSFQPRLAHFLCYWKQSSVRYTGFDDELEKAHHNLHCRPIETAGNGKMGLLNTSHVIYVEACEVLYTFNNFAVFGIRSLETFLYWRQSILPQRLASITRFHLNTQADCIDTTDAMFRFPEFPHNQQWAQVWDIITTRMNGLKFLTVHLKRTYKALLVLEPGEEWVKPMLEVRNLRRFRFELIESDNMPHWSESYNGQIQRLKEYLEKTLSNDDGKDFWAKN